jgi:O-antigen/teichoic acid export membrane protein
LASGLLTVGLGVAAVLIVISPWMIPFLFGSTYATAVVPMQLMAAAIPLRYGAHVYGTALSAAGFQARRSRLFLAVVITAIVLECVLIALGGLTGATVAIFLSSSLLAGAYFVSARRIWGVHMDARPIAGTWLVAALTFLSILALQR